MDELSEPFEVEGGWAVVNLTRIMEPEKPELLDVTEIVASRIRSVRMDTTLRGLLTEWAEEFPVVIHEDVLAKMPSWQGAIQEANEAQDAASVGKG